MTTRIDARLRPATLDLLRCPRCRAPLETAALELHCRSCGARYPITPDGIPILIDEQQSIFDVATFVRGNATFFEEHSRAFRFLRSFVPEVSVKPNTRRNLRRLRELLLKQGPSRVLVIGGGVEGEGMEELRQPDIELVETDAALGPRTSLICDAHSIPFADASFDAVLAQCVLEHVIDPDRCVAEFHRVLKPSGYVYAETAFLQHVHGGRYDFIRYSELGHRRLFRHFESIDTGAVSGPATVMAWSYEQLLLTIVEGRRMRPLVKAFARLSAFFLKYLDLLLLGRPAALDGASAVYFLGTRSDAVLSDRELLTLYRGAG